MTGTDMALIIIITVLLSGSFFGSLYIINTIRKARLRASAKKTSQTGKLEDAIHYLQKLVQKDPRDLHAFMQLAELYKELEDYSTAIFHLNRILTFERNHPHFNELKTHRLLGECYLSAENYNEAYKSFSAVRQINPNDSYAYMSLGRIEKKRGHHENALQYLSKAHSLEPDDATIAKELGIAFYESGKYPESQAALQRAISKNPKDPEINFYLAQIKLSHELYKEAFNHYLIAKKDSRFAIPSLHDMGKILMRFGKHEQALVIFTTALKKPNMMRDEMLAIQYELGEIYLIKKDPKAAIQQWEKILQHVSHYRDVHEKLKRYEQTETNTMLRHYLMASRNEFSALCEKIASKYTNNVLILRTDLQIDSSVELHAQAIIKETPVTIMFKFFRGNTNIGQLAIREFYDKVKETKAKLGVCFTTTEYSDRAFSFSKGRVLELHGRKDLLKILKKVSH